jgi:hypothetical protein
VGPSLIAFFEYEKPLLLPDLFFDWLRKMHDWILWPPVT